MTKPKRVSHTNGKLRSLTNTFEMAPKVELLYFDGYGRAEIIRIILNYGGVEFEDKRVNFEEWPKIKPSE